MRCAIYARVSTEEQNVDRQFEELQEFVTRMRWELIGEYSDKLSGATRHQTGAGSDDGGGRAAGV